jgi:hypothetical protein
MHRVRQEDLPFKGLSHNFVGADRGAVDVHLSPRFIQENLP